MNQKMYITIGGDTRSATLVDNVSTQALVAALQQGDITYEAHDYGGFEKVGDLPQSFPQNNTQITTQPGDLILYTGRQLCIYYGTNSWNFTRLGQLDNMSVGDIKQWVDAGGSNVSVRLSLNHTTTVHPVKVRQRNSDEYITLHGTLTSQPSRGVYVKDHKEIIIKK